ncbi:MAG: 2-dehydro-3-deoxy-D-gluconate 5-dehydrogenase @ 2-deoxy-D-gluconate 3-dehydrogenase [uncultured Arthrobacter sp.]|uniref:2-dehydro-3-deoxy-D-gluconate 5-dehydrogenase @ 2-deoxy-D-gluconate 3-dehydrogenase n=1 Tax=uncultured Arthrobacter sp. TaxID=114050 RepID=A0A6J4HZH2_9MICC|nr:SDR family oxidoreductase [uncultured Arthrobacter sp.]CAA9237416.1 MAG: 2-dehydro-3-deoxy-D-gluconate 5-dehydrogenase @ 2-deoxy-D-gluconate 3-dehydrogenase [uncultured Arthrobacter sp.]
MSNPFDLTGRTAAITGASRGIGQATARALLKAGADVIALQRSSVSAELEETAARLGRRIDTIAVDLTSEESIAGAITAALAASEVHILVNNAGTQIRHDAVEFPLADFDTVMQVNTRAVFQLCQGFGAPMLERGEGKIVNLASMLTFQGGFRVPAYAASKGAVGQLTKALSNEWAGRGVNVNAVAPGYFATDMNEALLADGNRSAQILERIPAGRWGEPDDLTGGVVFLSSRAADYIHGTILPIDGGWLGR